VRLSCAQEPGDRFAPNRTPVTSRTTGSSHLGPWPASALSFRPRTTTRAPLMTNGMPTNSPP